MRIFGFGSNSSGHNKHQQDRSGTFRKRHRVGERVSGRILRRERPGLAWVNFEGVELLAQIESNPEPGSTLLFQVMQLEPEIELKELAVARSLGDPLSPAADAFWSARTRFEAATAKLRDVLSQHSGSPQERQRAFYEAVKEVPRWRELWQRLVKAQSAASDILTQRGIGGLEYAPWLLPEALSAEMLVVRHSAADGSNTKETAFAFMVPGIGQCELKLLEASDKTDARLFMEYPDKIRAAEKLLHARIFVHIDAAFHGVSSLPPRSRAGVLAPLLTTGAFAAPRFSRRV